jgi:hypothetical protein
MALKAAAVDFYFNSWRLVPANLLWAAIVIGLILIWLTWPLLAIVLAPLLGLPTVGIFRLAALIARSEFVSFGDGLVAWRQYLLPALLMGSLLLLSGAAFGLNVVVGMTSGSPLGWAFATLAAWGLVAICLFALTSWPLLVDPRREADALIDRLRLAGLLVIAFPVRLGALALVGAGILVLSTVLFAALLTISVAYVALVACRYVLPAADRLEGRATEAVPERG